MLNLNNISFIYFHLHIIKHFFKVERFHFALSIKFPTIPLLLDTSSSSSSKIQRNCCFSFRNHRVSSLSMALSLSVTPSSSSSSRSLSPTPNFTTTHLNFASQRRIHAINPLLKSFHCLQLSSRDLNPSSFSISAIASSSSSSQTTELVPHKLHRLVREFKSLTEPIDRLKWVLRHANLIPPMPDSSRTESNRVMGCTARVWLDAELGQDGKMRFWADSDSDVSRGMCSCLIQVLDSATPEEVLELKTEDLAELNVGLLGSERSRVNTWHNVLVSMQKKTRRLVAEKEGKAPSFEPFPSLVLTSHGIEAKGSFAESQVRLFLCLNSQFLNFWVFVFCGKGLFLIVL